MCRLYGFLATEDTRLDCSLVQAQNALLVQSDRDLRGMRSPDGWGIAQWHSELPTVTKNTHPAFADRQFVDVASAMTSRAVIAHVRTATVGKVSIENTHPFDHGPWVFAHNGTIGGIEHVGTRLDIGLYGPTFGETDSELVFRWILNRMSTYGLSPDSPAHDLEPILSLVEDSLSELIRFGIEAGVEQRPSLNFILSDGRHMVASRWGNSLHWTFRRGVSDCVFCRSSHCEHADEAYRAVVIASEPITNEPWLEIPEGSLVGVGTTLATVSRSLVSEHTVPIEL
ncbi:MAG TPA: class II glutamine amidotransferase [Acidimicrobiia bacterium]|jgi:glutamine amidotransferase|nr:class II glutamine amidotransferase [Acidimicrobiia bacterium]